MLEEQKVQVKRTDVDGTIKIESDQVTRVDVKITCRRPCSLLSRTASISIVLNAASDNKRLVERLKTELDQSGIRYEIEDLQGSAAK